MLRSCIQALPEGVARVHMSLSSDQLIRGSNVSRTNAKEAPLGMVSLSLSHGRFHRTVVRCAEFARLVD
eukprot:4598019-Amphidinium_carterae.1